MLFFRLFRVFECILWKFMLRLSISDIFCRMIWINDDITIPFVDCPCNSHWFFYQCTKTFISRAKYKIHNTKYKIHIPLHELNLLNRMRIYPNTPWWQSTKWIYPSIKVPKNGPNHQQHRHHQKNTLYLVIGELINTT